MTKSRRATKLIKGSRCEKHDVDLLVWTRWDADTQRWKTVGSHDVAYCRTCRKAISMKTGKPLRKKGEFPPNLAGGNDLAAERAHAAIAAYQHFYGDCHADDLELGYFLADLLHYRDRYAADQDIDEALAIAERNYDGEISNNLADAFGVAEVVQVQADGTEKVISVAPRFAGAGETNI
jgi:hypothetical protein